MTANPQKIKTILTDDSDSFLDGLEEILLSHNQFEILGRCNNGRELIDHSSLALADLLLIDIEMPVMGGIEAATRINYVLPQLQMIAVTTNIKTIFLKDIICAGFKGFVYKPNVATELKKTIDKVLNNKFVFPKELNT